MGGLNSEPKGYKYVNKVNSNNKDQRPNFKAQMPNECQSPKIKLKPWYKLDSLLIAGCFLFVCDLLN